MTDITTTTTQKTLTMTEEEFKQLRQSTIQEYEQKAAANPKCKFTVVNNTDQHFEYKFSCKDTPFNKTYYERFVDKVKSLTK